jgi:rsbT co-antagonist protein RsbR
MDLRNYMKILKLDEAELGSRRAFFELTDADLERLADLRPFAERHTDAVVESFYQLLLSHPETKKFFPDEATVRRVKRAQRDYFLGLFTGRCDLAYVEDRLRVGIAHERIGLSTKWYLGAYRKYMQDILRSLLAELGDETRAREAFESIQKLVYFDVVIACDTYFAAKMDALERHQAAIRELSTPVIRVYDRVLLLPLIGAIDSLRADQIMDSVLLKVTEAQARCIIIDIAGVAVVDTKVADNLVKTTAAVRLLGAETILTGITAQVARTIVQLGVDISAMHTRSRLSEGIELALSLLGNTIQPRAARERKAASKRTRFEAE